MAKVSDKNLLECIVHIKGTWYFEAVPFCSISIVTMLLGFVLSVTLISGWKQGIILVIVSVILMFHMTASMNKHARFATYFNEPISRESKSIKS